MKQRRSLILQLSAILAIALASCARAPEWRRYEGSVWNTGFHITYRAAGDLTDSVNTALREVEMSLSPFNPGSRISAINRGETTVADSLILDVFAVSLKVSEASGGRFDPTVSPLVNLWGFGYDKSRRGDNAVIPAAAEIDSALALVGIADCGVDADMNLVKKAPGTTFNFSAVAKGYGCDRVGEVLRRAGATDYMVEIGGEIVVAGRNPRGAPWRVQIDAPVPDREGGHVGMTAVSVTDAGMATSGNYRNFRTDADGRRFGHTIDPVSGMPFQSDVLSATVVAPDCATADALATACMASPSADAAAMIERFPGAAALLVVAVADTFDLVTAGPFPIDR